MNTYSIKVLTPLLVLSSLSELNQRFLNCESQEVFGII